MGCCEGMNALVTGASRELLHRVARPVRSLDGKTIIGDAFLTADLEVVS
jgi:hypothetical protein